MLTLLRITRSKRHLAWYGESEAPTNFGPIWVFGTVGILGAVAVMLGADAKPSMLHTGAVFALIFGFGGILFGAVGVLLETRRRHMLMVRQVIYTVDRKTGWISGVDTRMLELIALAGASPARGVARRWGHGWEAMRILMRTSEVMVFAGGFTNTAQTPTRSYDVIRGDKVRLLLKFLREVDGDEFAETLCKVVGVARSTNRVWLSPGAAVVWEDLTAVMEAYSWFNEDERRAIESFIEMLVNEEGARAPRSGREALEELKVTAERLVLV